MYVRIMCTVLTVIAVKLANVEIVDGARCSPNISPIAFPPAGSTGLSYDGHVATVGVGATVGPSQLAVAGRV